eukprot:1035992-Prorocentrum_minimum.AAC.1
MALREHALDEGRLERGVHPEGFASPQSARFVGVVSEGPSGSGLHRVAGDVVAVAVHLLPELGVAVHVTGGDEVAVLDDVKLPVCSVPTSGRQGCS